jgi:hypothetical protein
MRFINKFLIITTFGLTLILQACSTEVNSSSSSTSSTNNQFYRAMFLNDDQSFLYSHLTRVGTRPVYEGPIPTKDQDLLYTYEFSGWDKPLDPIQSDTTFIAQFRSVLIQRFKTTFVNYDGTVLYESTVKKNENAYYGGIIPTRPNANNVTYKFNGWNESLNNIIKDTTFVATYTSQILPYSVKFLNYDNTLLDLVYVFHGDTATYRGNPPTRSNTNAKEYKFNGWDESLKNITQDTTVTAQFTESIRTYTVTFTNYDDSLLYTTKVPYGGKATYSESTPTKPFSGKYEYDFDKWDLVFSEIFEDLTVKALFKEKERTTTTGLEFAYDSNAKHYYVSGYWGSNPNLYVGKTYTTSQYGEALVAGIGSYAFNSNQQIKSVYLENQILFIGSFAFNNAINLTTVYLPDSLMSIGEYAFANTKLATMEIPKSVQTIGRASFYHIPRNATITVHPENRYYKVREKFLLNFSETILYQWLDQQRYSENGEWIDLKIPNDIETIHAYAFYENTRIRSLILPASLKDIGAYAFYGLYYLNLITFNDSPTTIGEYAFAYNYQLTSITFGKNLVAIGNHSFLSSQVSEINLPATVQTIAGNAFASSGNLSKITIASANPYFSVSEGVLYNKALTEMIIYPQAKTGTLTIVNNLQYLDPSVLYQNQLTRIEVAANNPYYQSIDGVLYTKNGQNLLMAPRYLNILRVPSSVRIIESYSLNYAPELVTLFFEEGVEVIKSNAFRDNQLRSITFPNSLLLIESQAFQNLSHLRYITFGDGLQTIGDYAFSYNNLLEQVTFGANLSLIENDAFRDNQNLKSLSFPNKLKTIESYAFVNNYKLTSVTFSDSITSIGGSAFYNCSQLEALELPLNLTVIQNNTFYGNSNLKSITFGDNLETIESSAFYNNTSLQELVFPEHLTTISDSAFAYATGLKTITFNDKLSSIGQYAFSNNFSLKSLTFGKGLKRISSYAFTNALSLETITFNDELTVVENDAFHNAAALHTLIVPLFKNWLTFSTTAFSNVNSIKHIYHLGQSAITVPYFGNNLILSSLYFYSETPIYDGVHWRFVEGVPTIWVEEPKVDNRISPSNLVNKVMSTHYSYMK